MSAPLRVVIADDEPLSLRRLELGLARLPDLAVVGATQDGLAARQMIRALRPDLVLLDVRMPGLTGIDLAAELAGDDAPVVILVTAFSRHAAKAFDLAVADYVLKPLNFERLAEAVERARLRIAAREAAGRIAELTAVVESLRDAEHGPEPAESPARELWISDRRGRVRIPLDEVSWFEAEREYVRIHLSGRSYLVRRSLRDLTARLDAARFQRLHRSALVNLGKIVRLARRPGGIAAVLACGTEIPVGRKFRPLLRARLEA
jgi:DNA-binding LytR/AlgR family response regulator